MPKATQEPTDPIYIEDTEDACLTAAHKIDAVMIFMRGLEELADDPDAARAGIDDGGYGQGMLVDILREIRDNLRRSANNERKTRQTEREASQ